SWRTPRTPTRWSRPSPSASAPPACPRQTCPQRPRPRPYGPHPRPAGPTPPTAARPAATRRAGIPRSRSRSPLLSRVIPLAGSPLGQVLVSHQGVFAIAGSACSCLRLCHPCLDEVLLGYRLGRNPVRFRCWFVAVL